MVRYIQRVGRSRRTRSSSGTSEIQPSAPQSSGVKLPHIKTDVASPSHSAPRAEAGAERAEAMIWRGVSSLRGREETMGGDINSVAIKDFHPWKSDEAKSDCAVAAKWRFLSRKSASEPQAHQGKTSIQSPAANVRSPGGNSIMAFASTVARKSAEPTQSTARTVGPSDPQSSRAG